MSMYVERESAVGRDKFPGVAKTINNAVIGIVGDWEAEVRITSGRKVTELFHLKVVSRQEEPGDGAPIGSGLSVACTMLYEESGGVEKSVIFDVTAKLYTFAGNEDRERELDLLNAVLHALVMEECFQNARMAIHARDLLKVNGIRDYLKKISFPAIIWPDCS